jgi:hypothetical protein
MLTKKKNYAPRPWSIPNLTRCFPDINQSISLTAYPNNASPIEIITTRITSINRNQIN